MANLHIHSIIQRAFAYHIHSIIFIFWISLQIFGFLPFQFLMGGLSLKIYNVRLIIFWCKPAPFPTFPIPGKAQSTESDSPTTAPVFTPTPHHPTFDCCRFVSRCLGSPFLCSLLWTRHTSSPESRSGHALMSPASDHPSFLTLPRYQWSYLVKVPI